MKPYGECDVDRVRLVRDHILAEPEAFRMDVYEAPLHQGGGCRTAACLCGWANHFRAVESGGPAYYSHENLALRWLGFSPASDAWRLFGVSTWPRPFRDRWDAAGSPAERAAVAADLLDYVCTDLPDVGEVTAPQGVPA